MNGPLNAAQIYEQVNGGPGTGYLADAQESAGSLTASLSERAQQVASLASKIQEGWTGEAGANAANAALPVAKASLEDASLLAKAGSALEDQTSAFGTVKNTVVPVPPNKPEMTSGDVFEAVVTGNWNGYNNKVGEWQAMNQQNIDAFAGYHASSMGNGDTMPSSFAPLADPGAGISLAGTTNDAGQPTGGIGGGQPNPVGGSQPHVPTQQSAVPSPQNVPPPGTPAPVPNQQPAPNTPSDNTKAAAYNPPVAPPPTPTPHQPPTTTYAPNGPHTGTSVPLGGGLRTGPGLGPGSTGGRTVTPAPIGRVPAGTGNGTGRLPGGTSSGPGVPGTGRTPGEVVAARGGPGAAGAAGRPGSTPVGGAAPGGANRGEEDKEHQRPEYLLGPDPEELFGGDREKPVPPVIGEIGKPT